MSFMTQTYSCPVNRKLTIISGTNDISQGGGERPYLHLKGNVKLWFFPNHSDMLCAVFSM